MSLLSGQSERKQEGERETDRDRERQRQRERPLGGIYRVRGKRNIFCKESFWRKRLTLEAFTSDVVISFQSPLLSLSNMRLKQTTSRTTAHTLMYTV